jgi:hypothetical protein
MARRASPSSSEHEDKVEPSQKKKKKKKKKKTYRGSWTVLAHAFNPSIWQAEAGRSVSSRTA